VTESTPTTRLVLVINSGSSTVKFALVDVDGGRRPLEGVVERIGTPDAVLHIDEPESETVDGATPDADHQGAVAGVLEHVRRRVGGAVLLGVGHRVVHGGDRFSESVVVDNDVLAAIRQFGDLAPLHNPANLLGIEAVAAALPGVPQVAVFDTAFHQTMPAHAYRYAVPEDWYAEHAVRRYGFHGTSHRYVAAEAAQRLGRPPGELRLVTAHLGNGCSVTAVRDGVSVDTTMGLTPLEGVVMGTRSGDVDPGLFEFIAERTGADVGSITRTLNHRSGLLGLSGHSGDMRSVETAAAEGNEEAELALEVFCYRAAKAIAALVVALDRLDGLVFTGGIGENSAEVRRRVVGRLGFLGLVVDEAANADHGRSTGGRITVGDHPIAIVVPTDEELLIARDTARLVDAE
jgi:acetate kinase